MMGRGTAMATEAGFLPLCDAFKLDYCCAGLHHAFGNCPYQVGSSLTRADYRDVDVRMMLTDEQFATMFPNNYTLKFMNAVVSEWLRTQTGLPIDFQFQDTTETNKKHDGRRNAMGILGRCMENEPPKVGG